ncbi:MAG: hypothetical protein IID16_00850 [Candidatus Marinimicrobia bacterium]|nr:hypothetical protein [Candidatus Neomarinimicrobiota bacterium]
MLDWEWYNDSKTLHLFIHLLISANHSDQKWQGKMIKRGQLITGRDKIKSSTGISIQSIRTSLQKLKDTKELTIKATNKYSLITVLNYDLYQFQEDTNQQGNQQLTNQQPTTNQQLTINKKEKNIKNEKNEKNINIPTFEDFLIYAKTIEIYHSSFDFQIKTKYDSWIENKWKTGLGKKIINWKNTLRSTMPYFKKELSENKKTDYTQKVL